MSVKFTVKTKSIYHSKLWYKLCPGGALCCWLCLNVPTVIVSINFTAIFFLCKFGNK